MKKSIVLLICLLISVNWLAAQTIKLSGLVLDNKGLPVEDVRVSINGSPFQQANQKGKFSFELPSSDSAEPAISTILAEKKGYVFTENWRWSSDTTIEVIMKPLTAFGGQIFDTEKQPLANATIRVVVSDVDISGKTDSSGSFTLFPPQDVEIDITADYYVNGEKVAVEKLIFSGDDDFVQISGQTPSVDQVTDPKTDTVKEEVNPDDVIPMVVTVLLETDDSPIADLEVVISDVAYFTNENGEFIVNDPLANSDNIRIDKYEEVGRNEDEDSNELILRLAKITTTTKVTPPNLLDTTIKDTLVGKYRKDFNIVLTQLEIRKQSLAETSNRIQKEMENVSKRLDEKEEDLSDEQKHILMEDLEQLQSAFIQTELKYQQAQLETKQLLDAMKNTLDSTEQELEDTKEKFTKELIVGIIIIVILIGLVWTFYLVAKRIRKQKDDLEASYRNIQTISEVGQKITAALDFENLIQIIHKNVNSLLDATIFGVGITNEAVNKIEFKKYIEKGETQSYFYESLDDHNKFSVWCLHNQKEVVINDLQTEYTKYIYKESFVPSNDMPQSLIYLPLIVEGKAIGVITVQSYSKNAYKELDTTILRTLAAYVSIALANSNAFEVIREKNRNITNSIRYAQTIQEAILPSENEISKHFEEHFIIYKPKDIVSGDFYWFSRVPGENGRSDRLFIAAVDCTGHGVPGAFMSMIGNTLLDETINQLHIYDTNQILEQLNTSVKEALNQEDKTNDDGMDVCLCCIEKIGNGKTQVSFTGAKRPLYYYQKAAKKIGTLKGDAKTIGGIQRKKRTFHKRELTLDQGDVLYLTSDGMVDQANPMREKFGTKRFLELLEQNAHLAMPEQDRLLTETLIRHQASAEQRDDILIVGIKL